MASKARGLADLGNVYSDGALSNRNVIINGGFDVWQRGTPLTNATGTYFSADRWAGYAGSTRTFTRDETSALDIGFKNCVKIEVGAANASFSQRVEDVRTLAGSTVTLSYYIKADVAHTPSYAYLSQNFGVGGSTAVNVNLTAPAVTTTWQLVKQTVTLPSVEGKTIGASSFLMVYPFVLAATRTYYITGVQLEVGDTATPFEQRSYADELQKCQRYYCKHFRGVGKYTSTTNATINGSFPVTMRATPTVAFITGTQILEIGIANRNASAIPSSGLSPEGGYINVTTLAATSGNTCAADTSVAAFDAEL